MPSPFPGMDPYLEGPLWTNFHTQFCVEIARQLAPQLRPRYVPMTEKSFYLAAVGEEEDVAIAATELRPDVAVADGAIATVIAPLQLATAVPVRVPQVKIEIRDVERRRLVTVIEVLSPGNKGSQRRRYVRKRRQILMSTSHLIEIDLLRRGRMTNKLPTIDVPLLEGDASVQLDLQMALTTVYDAFSYDVAIDYSKPPRVDLTAGEWTWIQEQLARARRGD